MITVVIASYKYGHLAAGCIESIICQTRPADKILFVDDGVGDCTHLPYLYPEVEYILREENMGRVANFQDMLDRVETDKCLFIGADNWLRADALELLDQKDADIVTYDIIVTGELRENITKSSNAADCSPYQGDYYWSRKMKHHGSMLYNVKMAQDCRYDSKGLNQGEDLVLWDAMTSRGAKVEHVEEGLLYYRRHRENDNTFANVNVNKETMAHLEKIKQMRQSL